MDNIFAWAYIGSGSIARQTAESISKTGRHRIVSVYSKTYSNAEKFASSYGAEACRSIEDAISAQGVQAVYIATTNDSHFAAAKLCLEHQKPVLLEKPFTVNKAEAEELIGLARKNDVYLAEAMWTWFSPVARQVKAWVDGGEIGDITHIEISYVNRVSHLYPRLFDASLGGGALIDIGVYPLAYLYNLLGMPCDIKCEGTLEQGVDVEENITLGFPSGLNVTAEVSIIKSPGYENLIITGTKGNIECPNYHMADKAFLIKPGEKHIFEGNGWYDNQFDIVAGEIMSGLKESAYVPLKATIDVMEIMDECRRQLGLKYPFE